MEAGPATEPDKKKKKESAEKSADLRSIEESLQQTLGTKVIIQTKKTPSKGSINISFFSFEDFDRIIKVINN